MDLQLENIRKAYGDKQVLRDCTFAFEKGKIYGLLGRNGAGKTTLFNCLTDEVPADGGRALLFDGRRRAADAYAGSGGVCIFHAHFAGFSYRL